MRATTLKIQSTVEDDCNLPRSERREAERALRAIGKAIQAIGSNLDCSAATLQRVEVKLGDFTR
ncbi:MAG TPA: hypothetical protein VIA62_11690 [Thermoanaerobaculia bacterium]|jgi:hypothetical protein|nr:hypothetical protein [Thermoanaerobaculia bacterium]